MRKVLIVEDDRELQRMWVRTKTRYGLGDELTIIQAFTINEARRALAEHKDIDLVALDGNLESPHDGLEFAEELSEWHKIPTLAMASNEEVREKMQVAGCQYECEKDHVFRKIVSILGISL